MERLTIPDKKIDGGVRRAFIDTKAVNKKLRHRGGFETFHCPNCDTSYQMDRRYTITDEYCPKCGKLLDSSFRSFCANCGQRLEEGRQC